VRPAWSVIFLTTLIGAGQGLFLALFAGVARGAAPDRFVIVGCAVSLVLAGLGLFASFFHLGRPERAWRSAAKWRTSWLSREVIALPAFMAATGAFGAAVFYGWKPSFLLALVAFACCLALFFCTAMIYACVKFLQEWASPFTFPNFLLMGMASGYSLAAALAAFVAPGVVLPYCVGAIVLTMAAFGTRLASLVRNDRIRPASSVQSAIGVRDPKVRQISQGFTGDSFNTLEFFHGRTPGTMARIRTAFLVLAFVAPLMILAVGFVTTSFVVLALAFVVQYAGLLLERWYFLAQANHPQNLYYQNRA
jgi:DMSO reductase anchor subunit